MLDTESVEISFRSQPCQLRKKVINDRLARLYVIIHQSSGE